MTFYVLPAGEKKCRNLLFYKQKGYFDIESCASESGTILSYEKVLNRRSDNGFEEGV